jgi:hypothetical protein
LTVRSAAIEGTIFYDRNTGRLTEGAPSTEGIIFLDNGRLIGLIGRDGEAIMPSVPDDGVVRWPEAAVEFMESLLRARDRSIGGVVGRRVRVEQWSKVEKVIPSLDVRPTLVPQTSGDVTLDREDWRLLRTINGRRTVSALAQTTHMSPAGTCERLMNLFRRGLVELNLTAPGTSADEIVGASQQVPTTESTAGSPKPVVVIVDESFEPNPGQQAMPPEPVPSGSSRRRHHPWVRHRKHM